MKYLSMVILLLSLTGCFQTKVQNTPTTQPVDLNEELLNAKIKLASILPKEMTVCRAKLLKIKEGTSIYLYASPRNPSKIHDDFSLFLWPLTNSLNIPHETGNGSHTYRPVGNSDKFRVYYSGFNEQMKKKVIKAFCTKKIKIVEQDTSPNPSLRAPRFIRDR